jgi:hypothetical protein
MHASIQKYKNIHTHMHAYIHPEDFKNGMYRDIQKNKRKRKHPGKKMLAQ